MKTVIKWNEGDGNIVANYEGKFDNNIEFSSDTINEGIDREQQVQVKADDISVSVLIKQTGLREIFSNDGEDFILADGGTFNVLKNGL